METIRIVRKYNKDTYCIGDFYVDDTRLCNTLEDRDRGLCQSMPLDKINKMKIYGKTAIPTGEYMVTFDVVPAWSVMRNFEVCKRYEYRFPRIWNIKGYDGVYIHNGNYAGHETYHSTISIPKDFPIFESEEYLEVI